MEAMSKRVHAATIHTNLPNKCESIRLDEDYMWSHLSCPVAIQSRLATALCAFKQNDAPAPSRTSLDSTSSDSITVTPSQPKYNLRRQTRRDSSDLLSASFSNSNVAEEETNQCPSPDISCATICPQRNFCTSAAPISGTCDDTTTPTITNNPSAMIALQQLASISSVQSLERIMPTLRKNLLVNTDNLYANRSGKLPRQSSKRLSQFETNRCPLCSRVYRSQAFLNEHMRKEHSVLI
ncbi:unnamed protein product [Ceratitis capitata]|uniref:(Mediterranean fruit fly) hypothetical protein n=1 Tax=Ceratitis capitata TaxID=7213 RepID=A0A811VEC2_CERCA|nr:unnamed protein product [Ceratitis capitata]